MFILIPFRLFVDFTEQISNKNKKENKQAPMKHWSLFEVWFCPTDWPLKLDRHLKCTHNTSDCQVKWAW